VHPNRDGKPPAGPAFSLTLPLSLSSVFSDPRDDKRILCLVWSCAKRKVQPDPGSRNPFPFLPFLFFLSLPILEKTLKQDQRVGLSRRRESTVLVIPLPFSLYSLLPFFFFLQM